jgi:hypothetical protein
MASVQRNKDPLQRYIADSRAEYSSEIKAIVTNTTFWAPMQLTSPAQLFNNTICLVGITTTSDHLNSPPIGTDYSIVAVAPLFPFLNFSARQR